MAFSLGGLLSGPGLTALSNSVGSYEDAQKNATQVRLNQALQQMTLQRQIQNTAIDNELKRAQTASAYGTGAMRLNQSRTPVPGSPEAVQAERDKAAAMTEGATPGLVARAEQMAPVTTKNAVAQQAALTPGAVARAGAVAQAEVPAKVAAQKSPTDHFSPTSAVDADGHPIIINTTTGQEQSGQGTPKGAAAGTKPGSAQSAMALQRLGMSLGDVESAISEMDKFENDPKMRAKLTAYQQAAGSASQVVPDDHAHGLMGVLNNAAGSLASSAARKTLDPDLQQYIRNRQRVGLAFTEALPRPNQALLGMEKGLSGIDAGGFSDPIIADVQARRKMGAAQLRAAISTLKPDAPSPGQSVTVSPLRAKYDAAEAHLKAQGKTPDVIHATLGDPPSDE